MQRELLRTLLASLLLAAVSSGDARAVACPVFQAGVSVGTVSDRGVVEASGLAASRQNPGVLWLQNDSGNPAELFAIGEDGRVLATYLPTGTRNTDWEGLAIGPGPAAGVDYLFIGDIGDNAAARSSITVYRIPEPVVSAGREIPLAGRVTLEMVYPDGPHDAEVLLSDPRTGDLYIVTKSRWSGSSGIYRYPFPHLAGSRVVLEHVASHTFPGNIVERSATGGDISADGSAIIVRTYTRAYLWARAPGSTVAAAFAGPACEIALVAEPQGEALAFAADLGGYYTLSEGRSQRLYFFRRVPAISSTPSLSAPGPLALVLAVCAAAFWARSLTQDYSRRLAADASALAALRSSSVAGATASSRALPAGRLGAQASHGSLGSRS